MWKGRVAGCRTSPASEPGSRAVLDGGPSGNAHTETEVTAAELLTSLCGIPSARWLREERLL